MVTPHDEGRRKQGRLAPGSVSGHPPGHSAVPKPGQRRLWPSTALRRWAGTRDQQRLAACLPVRLRPTCLLLSFVARPGFPRTDRDHPDPARTFPPSGGAPSPGNAAFRPLATTHLLLPPYRPGYFPSFSDWSAYLYCNQSEPATGRNSLPQNWGCVCRGRGELGGTKFVIFWIYFFPENFLHLHGANPLEWGEKAFSSP